MLMVFHLVFINTYQLLGDYLSRSHFMLCSTFISVTWIYYKLIVLFKKGSQSLCGNYRGISINDTLYRTFDKILYNKVGKSTSRVSTKQRMYRTYIYCQALMRICKENSKYSFSAIYRL